MSIQSEIELLKIQNNCEKDLMYKSDSDGELFYSDAFQIFKKYIDKTLKFAQSECDKLLQAQLEDFLRTLNILLMEFDSSIDSSSSEYWDNAIKFCENLINNRIEELQNSEHQSQQTKEYQCDASGKLDNSRIKSSLTIHKDVDKQEKVSEIPSYRLEDAEKSPVKTQEAKKKIKEFNSIVKQINKSAFKLRR